MNRSNLISHGSSGEDSGDNFRPQLTSLIDVMTILLVFLIKNFSVEGNIVSPSPNLNLPISTIKEQAKQKFRIVVSQESIIVDDSTITDISSVLRSDSLLIPSLYKKLSNHLELEKGEVMLEADKELDFAVIKKVMYTCSKVGFKDFSVLVLSKEIISE
jgi:biopolymer transport protein ExbD